MLTFNLPFVFWFHAYNGKLCPEVKVDIADQDLFPVDQFIIPIDKFSDFSKSLSLSEGDMFLRFNMWMHIYIYF